MYGTYYGGVEYGSRIGTDTTVVSIVRSIGNFIAYSFSGIMRTILLPSRAVILYKKGRDESISTQ